MLAEAQAADYKTNSVQYHPINPSISISYLLSSFKAVQSNPPKATINGIPNGILDPKEKPWL
jgi:hypothetical protein